MQKLSSTVYFQFGLSHLALVLGPIPATKSNQVLTDELMYQPINLKLFASLKWTVTIFETGSKIPRKLNFTPMLIFNININSQHRCTARLSVYPRFLFLPYLELWPHQSLQHFAQGMTL